MFSLRSLHCRARPSSLQFSCRLYSAKSNIQLVAELRKLTSAPISKARQALAESNGDLNAAMKWLEKDLADSGAAKAEKVKDRAANEGLVSVSVTSSGFGSPGSGLGAVKAAIIELNCESDFVARTDEFGRLAHIIARTVAESGAETSEPTFTSLSVSDILHLPLFESHKTVGSSILDIIARIGENISLRRATSVSYAPEDKLVGEGARVGFYAHGASNEYPLQGKMAALSLTSLHTKKFSEHLANAAFVEDMDRMDRALARQIVGFNPAAIGDAASSDEMHLYAQQFMMHGGPEASLLVRDVLEQWRKKWGLDDYAVDAFVRWQVGEAI